MRKITFTLCLLSLLLSSRVFADEQKDVEAAKLLDSINMEDTLQASISQMLDVQLQQAPEMAPYKGVMLEYFSKYMSYESLKSGMVEIYSNAFTLEELRDINAFYSTSTGKKTILKMPELIGQGAQLGVDQVQKNIGELTKMIESERERLKKSQSKLDNEREPELPRYYALADLAKSEVNKDLSKAESLAKELLHLSSVEPRDWNYGNAIHFGNMVLGQVALRKGEIEKAEMYLLKSGETPGSPQLDTFGPNMSLAKELLEAKRLDAVLKYFELCSKFWKMSDDKLEVWAILAQNGKMPEFGANLVY